MFIEAVLSASCLIAACVCKFHGRVQHGVGSSSICCDERSTPGCPPSPSFFFSSCFWLVSATHSPVDGGCVRHTQGYLRAAQATAECARFRICLSQQGFESGSHCALFFVTSYPSVPPNTQRNMSGGALGKMITTAYFARLRRLRLPCRRKKPLVLQTEMSFKLRVLSN
jgi:hypothetical protein